MRLLVFMFGVCASAAADTIVTFDPPQTQIRWTLSAMLHTVHGTFQLKSGRIRFDPVTGKASGQLVVSAASGESGNESRDKHMHQSILESARFADIVFTPDQVIGKMEPEGKSTIQVHGNFHLHGAGHEFTLPVEVEMRNGQAAAVAHFSIPYLRWGLKNPSTFVLRVGDSVDVEIQASAKVTNGL